jgi:hypothetical protein
MDSRAAQRLMQKYANAMAYIEIKKANGTRNIGSCFHVGNGVFVTARHVIEGNNISEVKLTEPVAITTKEYFGDVLNQQVNEAKVSEYEEIVGGIFGTTPKFKYYQSSLNITIGPFYHPDPMVDVAVFQVSSVHPETGIIRLGSHLDDWIDRYNWQMSEAIVLGYPPIPLTSKPHLVGVKAEVNATVSLYSSKHIHFILSAIPRGGFSGGLALSEYDFALGLITQSLIKDNRYEELGFFAVLAIESIYECLSYYKLLPIIQKEGWDDFWNTHSTDYVQNEQTNSELSKLMVSLELIDDGQKMGIGFCSYDKSFFCKINLLISQLLPHGFLEIKVHETFKKYIYDFIADEIKTKIYELLAKIMSMCLENGFVAIRDEITPDLLNFKVHIPNEN